MQTVSITATCQIDQSHTVSFYAKITSCLPLSQLDRILGRINADNSQSSSRTSRQVHGRTIYKLTGKEVDEVVLHPSVIHRLYHGIDQSEDYPMSRTSDCVAYRAGDGRRTSQASVAIISHKQYGPTLPADIAFAELMKPEEKYESILSLPARGVCLHPMARCSEAIGWLAMVVTNDSA
jgi:hypothetical protein